MGRVITKAPSALPTHLALILDGNGRWAEARGRPRTDGHVEGLKTARRLVEEIARRGVKYLTLYVFSTENWKRSKYEVEFVMGLVKQYLVRELDFYRESRVRVRHAGDLARLAPDIGACVTEAVERTKLFDGLQVILALNYGGRDEIVRAVNRFLADQGEGEAPRLSEAVLRKYLDNPDVPDPDLVIRTAGEYRTSNFLLWESAYAEYYISGKLWPDFTAADLDAALAAYGERNRRFGGAGAGGSGEA